eukprot:CAMPEP_0198253716 /NCGR_PEP_ID=MMETSP1447-20131203/4111_1 /TAXON_ID=420782 /ORGANISM="Chaetoceros dichaeta, Strain CCMP1751" /LENGTH=108 /DNA_ID=CAMNT_0043939503 /DNA_START=80 /DNA_END=406 /DNA_ORIENTATION=+
MSIYEEVEIEDLDYDPVELQYTYPCPCGDVFQITLEELWDGEDIAPCPSCTLRIMIIYEEDDLPPLPDDFDDDSDDSDESEEESVAEDTDQTVEEKLIDSMQKNLTVH